MFDADAVIKKVDEIKECERTITGLSKLIGYDIVEIRFKHPVNNDTRSITFSTDADVDDSTGIIKTFVKNELDHYSIMLTTLKQELKDL